MATVLTATFTALLMMVHSVVGCCWHHGHTVHHHDGHGSNSVIASHDADATDHGHSAEDAFAALAGIDEPVQHDGCQERSCTYLRPQCPSIAACMPACAGIWDASQSHGCVPEFFGRRAPRHPGEQASVPLRAALSVWLL